MGALTQHSALSGFSLAVVVPTRNRPERLVRCLEHLAAARDALPFPVYVVDSSTEPELRAQVEELCARHDFVRFHHHEGKGVGAARNACARVSDADLLVNVDDDVYVYPDSIARLFERYRASSGWRVVAGSVAWGDSWSHPVVTRKIGYGRWARPGEAPHFIVGAFFLYPRALALSCPWIESIPTADDRMMGSLWRRKGVKMQFEPEARAQHDARHHVYGVRELHDHFYSALFDSLIANPAPVRALIVELFGVPAALRRYARNVNTTTALLRSWGGGHLQLIRDWRSLQAQAREPLPAPPG